MAGVASGSDPKIANLHLTSEEQRLFTQVFAAANPDGIEVVTGDVALRFFPEKTKLPSETLGEIWQIADTEDKGFLTEDGFYILLRLIGYAQTGRSVDASLALKPGGPLPRFEGINVGGPVASPLQAQGSGGPIKVPPLAPENAQRYAQLFEQSGAQNGLLDGSTAKMIFDRSQLPNDILVRIWNLADTEQRGLLSITEFIIAMHLLASYRSGAMRALPRNLPAGLYDAASRRGAPSRPTSGGPPVSAIPRQFSGPTTPRTSSPLASRPPTAPFQPPVQPQNSGGWLITPQEKTQYDGQFAKLDTQNQGFITGEQAAAFFGNSRLPEDDLAQIWDLADMRSEGQLNRGEFAVAMHLIRNQLNRRGPIPKTIPPNLMPPSQSQAQAVPTSPPKPKSAVDDLFGLDALSDGPVQAPIQATQATGSSTAALPQPIASPTQAAEPVPPAQPTFFKPFIPTSSFGQSVVSPQPTGASTSSPVPSQSTSQQQSRSVTNNDDLLGDTDPEISKRLTNETTELANLSNQVGNLANQMQEVKTKNASVDSTMTSVATQKRDFETRLAQLRTAYEQEARDLRNKEEKLANVQIEVKKLQADAAMVEHSFTNLQEKKKQAEQSLETQQKEIAGYKEQLREINAKVAQIKPEMEKAESSLRQQKGLNAITKKQVSTAEAEFQRLREQLDGLTRENEDAVKEAKDLDDTQRDLQNRQSAASAPVVSPAPSTASQSTNPFFRRQTTSSSVRSPLAQEAVSTPNHSAFDSFFGSAFPTSDEASAPPPTSFGGTPASPTGDGNTLDTQAAVASDDAPATPPQPTSRDLPSSTQLPPPPPQSRQITSSSLPFRDITQRPASPTSSIGVAPPASRFGDGSGYNTPAKERQASQATVPGTAEPAAASSPLSQTHVAESATESVDNSQTIPGSFPGDNTPPARTETPGSFPAPDAAASRSADDDPFGKPSSARSLNAKDDFDSAFAGFEDKGKAPATADAFGADAFGTPTASKDEFPPIQEFEDDSESESEKSKGFEDDFTSATSGTVAATAATATASSEISQAPADNVTAALERPDISRGGSTATQLPAHNAQQPPPSYDQTIEPNGKVRSGSNHFPAEYGGLLPSREEPPSTSDAVQSPVQETSAGIRAIPSGEPEPKSEASQPTVTPAAAAATAAPPSKSKDAFDDFDDEFGDLSESNLADEKGEEEDLSASRHADFDEAFNPTFDSPAPSKMTASSAFGADGAFDNFESSVSTPIQASGTSAAVAGAAPAANNLDWDSMFADLGKEGGMPAAAPQTNGNSSATAAADEVFGNASAAEGSGANAATASTLAAPQKPPLARAITEGTEHDDPILKRLTAMGYPRDQSLSALEKFDYNIDKAADHLTTQ